MADRIKPVTIKLDPLPPEACARLEIMGLASVSELQTQSMLGGPTPPEMQEENERRRLEYRRRKLAIIKKYDVVELYLNPLLLEERRLKSELLRIQEEIAALQSL